MIGIHHREGGFSQKWVEYCEQNNISYVLVDCFNSDIIKQLEDCQGLMWHWLHYDYRTINFARQLTYSLEHTGKKVFPNSKTCWHFDDKVGQKYLLEASKCQFVKSYVFYDKKVALEWAADTSYPKVFKLRGGAGSLNVKLVNNKSKANLLINKAFGSGFSSIDQKEKVKDRWGKLFRNRDIKSFEAFIRGLVLFLKPNISLNNRLTPRHKGYVYFQDFIPNNSYDIRIIVIGDRAFGIKRMVRKGDFKASGSGLIIHNKEQVPIECVELSFSLNKKLEMQSVAFDYVFVQQKPYLVEISYGFDQKGYLKCPGYWDEQLNWHQGAFTPEWFIIEDFLNEL